MHRRTCSGNIDFRIPSIPHSTVEQVDTNRNETVERLFKQFENHPNCNVLLIDFAKAEARVATLEISAASGPAATTRQDLGTYLDIVIVSQPLGLSGPMAQGHLMTIETQDVDLILSLALKMIMHAVPSYSSFRVSNTTLELPCGSIASGRSPTYQPTTNPQEFIAKQLAYPPDSYSRRELNVRTLWLDK